MQNLTAKAATLLYALETLKAHDLQGRALWDVTQATLMAQITYASPSCREFIKAEDEKKQHAWRLYCQKYAVTNTFLLTSIPLKIY